MTIEQQEGEEKIQWDLTFPDPEWSEQSPIPAPRKGLRAEAVMGILAGLCALLAAAALIFSLPYMFPDEDPESVLDRSNPLVLQETVRETILEPTISETQPENPTIPPDRNPYNRYDFQYTRHNYLLLQDLPSVPGIDVSAHQRDINWKKVKASGIQFAMIRLGYRGYGAAGKLVEDEYAAKNLKEAKAAGLQLGAYFFSQAVTVEEADEEIAFMLKILGDYQLDMPIVLDWEVPTEDARTAKLDSWTLMNIQLHFCQVMVEKGYQPMVYFNWHQSENMYVLSELEEYPFWLALYQDRMTYPWKVEMWQYTDKGRVPGIEGPVDVNVYMPD